MEKFSCIPDLCFSFLPLIAFLPEYILSQVQVYQILLSFAGRLKLKLIRRKLCFHYSKTRVVTLFFKRQ